MTFLELIKTAAQIGKDIPSDKSIIDGITDEASFNAQNPRFAYAIWGEWINESFNRLLYQLPTTLIKEVVHCSFEVVDGFADLPKDLLRIKRITINVEGATRGARYKTQDYFLGTEYNTWLRTDVYHPYYTFENQYSDIYQPKIRFSPPNVTTVGSMQYIRSQKLVSYLDTPYIQEQFHYLLAEMAASKKLAIDGDETALSVDGEVKKRLKELQVANPEIMPEQGTVI